MGQRICVAFALLTLAAVAWLRWPLLWVILGLGSLAIGIAWKQWRP
jgi:chromate transporter